MIASVIFTQRYDCFCHIKSTNASINSGCILQIRSILSKSTLHLTCKSVELNEYSNTIELSGLFGWHSSFKHNEEVLITVIPNSNFRYGSVIDLVPVTNDEWELINKNCSFIEQNFLQQICCLHLGMVFPIWVGKMCLLLKVDSMTPSTDFCIVTTTTKLTLNPNFPKENSYCKSEFISQTVEEPIIESKSLTKKKNTSIFNSFYAIFDFIHYLMYGKSFKQKRKENNIFQKWELDFQLKFDIIFDQKFFGRCFQSSNHIEHNSTLSYLKEPILILISQMNVINRNLFEKKEILAKIEIIPFTLSKSKNSKISTPITEFISLIQMSESSDLPENAIHFIIPSHVWKEFNFQIGDRASCKLIEYKKKSVKKLIFDVNTALNPILSQKIIDAFKQSVASVQNEFCPLLIRQNMEIPLYIEDKKLKLIAKYPNSKDSNNDDVYYLISSYFFQNNLIDLVIQNNSFNESSIKTLDKENNSMENEHFNDNPVYKELLSQILDDNDIKSRNILIHGPSGIGKSLFCQNLCHVLRTDEKFQYFVALVDCRDLIGKQPDSINRKIRNILLECMWRSPSIICLDNLDILIPNYQGDDANQMQVVLGDCIASMLKYFFETVNKIGINSRIISVSTCRSVNSLHKSIIQKPFKSTTIFTDVIDFTKINKNVFWTVVDESLKEMEVNNLIDKQNHEEILSNLKLKFGVTDNLCGFDAVTLTKNAIVYAIKRAIDDSITSNVKMNFSDMDNSLVLSSSYKLSNLNKRQKPVQFFFQDLYGLDDAKNKLNETFVWPSLYPDLFRKSPIKLQQGCLLYGLPGSGKSHLALALSNEVKMNFRMIKGPELLSKYIGASEEQVRMLFNESRRNQPILLFFDEFDALAPRRGHDNTGVTDRVVNQLLTEIDGISDSQSSGIFILAASNRPDLIDPAILRPGRISGKIHCKLPVDAKDRVGMLRFFLEKSEISIADETPSIWNYIESKLNDSKWLQSYSYADLLSIVHQTENKAVMRFNKEGEDLKCKIILEDFKLAVANSRPSLTLEQISYYLKACQEIEINQNRVIPLKSKVTLA